jgi:hypothetical protein
MIFSAKGLPLYRIEFSLTKAKEELMHGTTTRS